MENHPYGNRPYEKESIRESMGRMTSVMRPIFIPDSCPVFDSATRLESAACRLSQRSPSYNEALHTAEPSWILRARFARVTHPAPQPNRRSAETALNGCHHTRRTAKPALPAPKTAQNRPQRVPPHTLNAKTNARRQKSGPGRISASGPQRFHNALAAHLTRLAQAPARLHASTRATRAGDQFHHMLITKPTSIMPKPTRRFQLPMLGIGQAAAVA